MWAFFFPTKGMLKNLNNSMTYYCKTRLITETQIYINSRIDKQAVIWSYNRIFYNNENENAITTYNNMDESHMYNVTERRVNPKRVHLSNIKADKMNLRC